MKGKTNKLTRTVLAIGVLSMVLSACLCVGSTYAWFNHSLGSENTIMIGTFRTVATAGLSEARSVTHLSAADTIFSAGSYDVSVRGVGNTPGYALIFLEAATSDFRKDVYYTPQLNGGTGYTYRIVLHEPTAIRVTPVWGRMEGNAPLEEDEIIWYGRPPVVEQPEEEQTQSVAPDQTGGVTATPPTESAETVTPNDSTQTAPPTDSTPTTPPTDSTSPTNPADGAESVPAIENVTAIPPADSMQTATASGSAQSNSVTGGTETTPAMGGTQSNPATSGTQTSTTTGSTDGASAGTPSASSAEMAAPTTGGADGMPTAGGADRTPAAGGATGTPAAGGADSAPATGGADSAPTTGSDPE